VAAKKDKFWDATFYDQLLRRAIYLLRTNAKKDGYQPEDLVHDAYIRLSDSAATRRVSDRQHYFAIATTVMRRSLIDRRRAELAYKRFGHLDRQELNSDCGVSNDNTAEQILINDLFEKCASHGLRLPVVARMHFIEGKTADEIGSTLSVSNRTVKRDLSALTAQLQASYQMSR
jgi:RNA polymerase sigma factor (TIGR02999 family)